MTQDQQTLLKEIARHFQIAGDFVKSEPYGSGHINDTYAVWFFEAPRSVRYIFQRVNHNTFKNVPGLMENVDRVTRHQKKKCLERGETDIGRRVLNLVPTLDGSIFHVTADGNFWRVYLFIEGARTYDIIEKAELATAAARAFGQFQCDLADMPEPRLHETVPGFHHTRSRFDAFVQAVEADVAGRASLAKAEIEAAMQQESSVDVLLDLQAAGELPERVTHNDTKLNNVMIDDSSGEGICVIDLDTVMPGLALYDFGDMVRTATNTGAEDEQDLSKIRSNPEMFEAITRGYLDTAGPMLVPKEIELLPFAGRLITFEIGLRFLTDYLSGDVYFKTKREHHNLDRCRVQFHLAESIRGQEEAYSGLVSSVCQTLEIA